MPWTLSHPAAVLPLRSLFRNRLPFDALVVGSLTPDLPFYFGWFDVSRMAHTLWGLLTLCLPSGLVLLALIRSTRGPVAALLPSPHRQRLLTLPPRRRIENAADFLFTVFAILVGALTHIAWDAFTHSDGFFVMHMPIFWAPVISIGPANIRLYEIMQDGGSLVGALILILAYRRWGRRVDADAYRHVDADANRPTVDDDRWRYHLLAVIAGASMLAAAPIACFAWFAAGSGTHVRLVIIRELIWSTTIFTLLTCIVAVTLARTGEAILARRPGPS